MPEGTLYTCPMHPEIVQDGAWRLPDLRHGAGADDAVRRCRAEPRAGRFPAPALGGRAARAAGAAAGDGRRCSACRSREWFGHGTARWLQFVLATPVVLWAARPFFKRGWSSIVTGNLNMFTLIAHRHRRGLWLQPRRRCCCPGIFPDSPARRRRPVAGLFRGGGGDRDRWCCSGRCWSSRRGTAPATRSARCSTSRPRPRAGVDADGGEEDVPLDAGARGRPPARAARARRCRSTATSLEGRSSVDESDADRRADAGGEGGRRRRDRRHAERDRLAS